MSGRRSAAGPSDREAVFHREFLEDLRHWVEADRRVALRALALVDAVVRDPFEGVGKPEPLKHALQGCWSRRLTQEHRIVYAVIGGIGGIGGRVHFLQARYHY